MKRKMLLIPLALLLAISLVAIGCAKPAPAPAPAPELEVIEWRFHTPHTEARAEYVLQQDFVDMVYEATDGRLKITPYPGRALGFKDGDMLRLCGGGSLESFMSYPGYVSRDEPSIAIILPNFVLRDREELIALMPVANKNYRVLYGEWNIRVLTQVPTPLHYLGLASTESLSSLELMKGKKIRCFDIIQAATLNELGIPAEIMPQSESYMALKTGMLDGTIHTLASAIPGLSLYEVADYFSIVGLSTVTLGVSCGEDALRALPPDIQNIVLQVAKEHEQKWFELGAAGCPYDDDAIVFLKEQGMTMLEFSDADKELLTDTGAIMWVERAEEYGTKAVMYQEMMQAELERIRAE